MSESQGLSRRTFIAASSAVAVAASLQGRVGAEDAEPIRIALIGCGGRGTGAADNSLASAPNVKLVALADLFEDRLNRCRKWITGKWKDAAALKDEDCYVGFDAYQKVMARADVDVVLLTTPPGFRPMMLEAAVEAGKHVFMEKPVAVDPVGVRRVIAAGEAAKGKNLAIVAGTQYRHHKQFIDTIAEIHDGRIGELKHVRAYYNTGTLWHHGRPDDWTDVHFQVRNWLYFDYLAGDHITEQHIHTIDVCDWAIGARPVAAVATGGRLVRSDPKWGNIYDHFAVDFEYPNGLHCMSMCRQMDKTTMHVGAHFVGTQGVANPYRGKIEGKYPWKFSGKSKNAYVQEHTALIEGIRNGKPLNEARQVAESTMTSILGREAAYTGKRLEFDKLLNSDLHLGKEPTEFGERAVPPVPMPGQPRPGDVKPG